MAHTPNISAFMTNRGQPLTAAKDLHGAVSLFDEVTGNEVRHPPFELTEVCAITIGVLAGRTVVVSGGRDGSIRLWNAIRGKPVGKSRVSQHGQVTAVALGWIGGRVVSASATFDQIGRPDFSHLGLKLISHAGTTIRLQDARTGRPIGMPIREYNITSLALGAAAGRVLVVSGNFDGAIQLWDVGTGEPASKPFIGHRAPVSALAMAEVEGRPIVLSGSEDGTILLWNARLGQPLTNSLKAHDDYVRTVEIGVIDGRAILMSGSNDRTIRMWDARSHRELLVINAGSEIVSIAHSSSGVVAVLGIGLLSLEFRLSVD